MPKMPKWTFRSVSAPIKTIFSAFGITMFNEFKLNISHGLILVYTFFVASILLAAIVFRMQYISPRYGNFNVVIHSVICIQQILIMLTIFAIYYQTIRHPYRMNMIFQLLANVDRALAQFNVESDYYRRFCWKTLIEIIVLIVAIHITFTALCIHYGLEPFVAIVYELLARFYPIFVINAVLLMFINLCCVVKSKFVVLKKLLRKFHVDDTTNDQVWKAELMQTTPCTFCDELKRIANVYELLYAIVNRLNTIFGLTNLASLTFLGISLTCHLFLLMKILMENPSSSDDICLELLGLFINFVMKHSEFYQFAFYLTFSVDHLDADCARIHYNHLSFDCC